MVKAAQDLRIAFATALETNEHRPFARECESGVCDVRCILNMFNSNPLPVCGSSGPWTDT